MIKIPMTFLLLLSNQTFAKVSDDVVATVNGKKVTAAFFEQVYKKNLMFVNDKKLTKEVVLENIINRELGIQKAQKEGLSQNPVVREKLEDILFHAQISKDLENDLQKIDVKEDEIAAYYNDNQEYRTAHILIRLQAEPTKEEVDGAMATIVGVHAQLSERPSLFPELANKYSQTSVAPNGGDVGFQPAVKLAPEYFEAIKGQQPGYISPIIRTQYGLHIIKVIEVKKYDQIQKDLYKKIVFDIKRDKLLNSYFKSMRDKANIVINKKLLN